MLSKQTGLLVLAALGLAACASGGGNGGRQHIGGSGKTVAVAALKQGVETEIEQAVAQAFGTRIKLNGKYTVSIGGKTYREGQIDLAAFNAGFHDLKTVETLTDTVQGTAYTATRTGRVRMYQQPYSVVAGYVPQELSIRPSVGGYSGEKLAPSMEDIWVKGSPTQTLPAAGSATYNGTAFSANQQGRLTYTVNFDTQKGSGLISGIAATGQITLNEAAIGRLSHTNSIDGSVISGHGIAGTAVSEKQGSGQYQLGFFGSNAEEIAGAASNRQGVVGFGGKR